MSSNGTSCGDRDSLRYVLHGGLQQLAAEAKFLGRLVQQFGHVFGSDAAPGHRVSEHQACGGCADGPREPPLHRLAPATDLPAGALWRLAAPESVRSFSAACYFAGRELRDRA